MTKLEEKLKELEYERNYITCVWEKDFNEYTIKIYTVEGIKGWVNVEPYTNFRRQSQIDNLQQAFNVMQQDLEKLKNVKS